MCTQGRLQINKNGKLNYYSCTDINDNAFLENHISDNSNLSENYTACEQNTDPNFILNNLQNRNSGRLIISHLNINSFQNKFMKL